MILGAIIGDVVGSRFEWENMRSKDFELFDFDCKFTDDSVMTCAIADSFVSGRFESKDVAKSMRSWYHKHPNRGYGGYFRKWCNNENAGPYNSWGNGSAMRTSSVAYFANTLEECVELATRCASVTHNHPEGIKGAVAISVVIWMAKHGKTKDEIREYIEKNYYSLDYDYEELVLNNNFNESCEKTAPVCIYCFLIGNDFEDCIRTAISIGGDTDTIGCIVGSMAEAYYGIPDEIKSKVLKYISRDMYILLKRTGDVE